MEAKGELLSRAGCVNQQAVDRGAGGLIHTL